MNITVNRFAKRHIEDSRFSHFDGSWVDLLNLVRENWESSEPGYREGVILINVPSERFYSSVVELKEGDDLSGGYKPRKKGETPRKTLYTLGRNKSPASSAQIVLYSSAVLAESEDNDLSPEEENWEIISINASCVAGGTPMPPHTLMHNHFGSDGGTDTHLSDAEFVEMLRESFEFWKNKAMCG